MIISPQSLDTNLSQLLAEVKSGSMQLPEFQRDWTWDDNRIRGIIASLSQGYPMGAIMRLQYGNPDIQFKYRTITGVKGVSVKPEHLLIGEGEQEEKMKNMAASLGIYGKVIFAGLQSNVNEWYQAMDVFVMPSLFEGLPVVGVEAQASGLPCIFSSAVTDEILLSPFSCRVPLSASDKEWADEISSALNRPCDRTSGTGYIREAGYDIASEASRIQELYISMSDRK